MLQIIVPVKYTTENCVLIKHRGKKKNCDDTKKNMENILKRFLPSSNASNNEKTETKASPQNNFDAKNNNMITTQPNSRSGMKRQTSIDQDQNFYLM